MMPPAGRRSGRELPGTVVLREALRSIRHVAREGRDAVVEAASHGGAPVARVANFAITGADRMAEMAEEVVGLLIGAGAAPPDLSLADMPADEVNAACFAAAAYSALGHVLRGLGARHALVSEMRLRAAFLRGGGTGATTRSARLFVAMSEAEVIADVRMEPAADLSAHEAERLALFAMLLWMLSDRDIGDASDALDAASMIAIALRSELACAEGDEVTLAALLKEFRHHV
ncbi:hypothetical protein [Limimaricola cinnabarinus]|uniref:Uncharacterized protein n=1 Tax=Limimaricola cinnabarinus LL-001 TaxID=1337093 RepID=U2YK89_9RHOB|nr:hypothetical protein [Limimaricola cinnabarinus]GAD55331.1 hypothetical protein MBELCI_1383 [Limimaricola cinnabarinus LL-001]